MLTIKPATSPSKDPDPASIDYSPTQVIFVQDEPTITQQQNEPEIEDFKMAKRDQGGSVALQHSAIEPKQAQQDQPTPALSSDYKNGIQNQTTINDQDEQGDVNILDDAIIDKEEQREKQAIQQAQEKFVHQLVEEKIEKQLESPLQSDLKGAIKQLSPANILKTIMQEKMHTQTEIDTSTPTQQDKNDNLQPLVQKVVSKKHRPADTGQENTSKVQLSKIAPDTSTPKKKISLQDIQSGFSQFIRSGNTVQTTTIPSASMLGNSLFFSTDGNSDKDDIAGLKRASYMHQIGQMYQNAGREYIDMIVNIIRKEGLPYENNYVNIIIERSGKISQVTMTQSCGNAVIDNYHIKAINAIGDFPPIPKYIPAPMRITAYLPFRR